MNSENAIEVHNITKSFKIYPDKGNTLKERALFSYRRRFEKREVLKGISFNVKKGEAVGLIGHNGCGKSTTLKLLTRIMYPDSGTIEMRGRVSSLIELGAGFHPDMSGRENIYINASIFGLSRKEIDARLDDIIRFSELEEFIDNPVRTYSSGMYMRLAFSVAINVDADILLIDEILAVGDAAFQAKCFNKLREIKAGGTTIVIVSHALSQIEQICERSIWIHEGSIREDGSPRVVDPIYMKFMSDRINPPDSAEKKTDEEAGVPDSDGQENTDSSVSGQKGKRWGTHEAVMEKIRILNKDGIEQNEFSSREPFTIHIEYTADKELNDVVVGIAIYRSDELYLYGDNTLIDTAHPFTLKQRGFIECRIDCMLVTTGSYTIDLALHRPDGFNYDFIREACQIHIKNEKNEVGVISLPHEWLVN